MLASAHGPRLAGCSLLALLLLLGLPARAQDVDRDARPGFELGVRLVLGGPFGKTSSNPALTEWIRLQVTPMLDVGFRASRVVFIGAYGSIGPLVHSDICSRCSSFDLRAGGQVHFHLQPNRWIDPWLGLGVGYELWRVDLESGGASAFFNVEGFDTSLQFGFDVRPLRLIGAGVFLIATVGQFVHVRSGGIGLPSESSAEIPDKAVHGWFLFGLRATLNP